MSVYAPHHADPNFGKLTSLHFYAWKKGLKTGMYYLRTRYAGAPTCSAKAALSLGWKKGQGGSATLG
jgi:hypothetical protein